MSGGTSGKGMVTSKGYSLVEMMIVIAVMAILMGIAAPAADEWITNMRMTSQANDLLADIMLARSEAGARGVTVTLCPSSDPTATAAICTATNDWASGRIVIVTNLDGTSSILRVGQALTGGVSLLSLDGAGAARNSFTFSSLGALTPIGSGGSRFDLCPQPGSSVRQGRRIVIDTSGRPNITRVACP